MTNESDKSAGPPFVAPISSGAFSSNSNANNQNTNKYTHLAMYQQKHQFLQQPTHIVNPALITSGAAAHLPKPAITHYGAFNNSQITALPLNMAPIHSTMQPVNNSNNSYFSQNLLNNSLNSRSSSMSSFQFPLFVGGSSSNTNDTANLFNSNSGILMTTPTLLTPSPLTTNNMSSSSMSSLFNSSPATTPNLMQVPHQSSVDKRLSLFPPSEQDVLDNGFFNLFGENVSEKSSTSLTTTPTSLSSFTSTNSIVKSDVNNNNSASVGSSLKPLIQPPPSVKNIKTSKTISQTTANMQQSTDLFSKINQTSSTTALPNSSQGLKEKSKKQNLERNLIDLETKFDFAEMSVVELFDPLAAKNNQSASMNTMLNINENENSSDKNENDKQTSKLDAQSVKPVVNQLNKSKVSNTQIQSSSRPSTPQRQQQPQTTAKYYNSTKKRIRLLLPRHLLSTKGQYYYDSRSSLRNLFSTRDRVQNRIERFIFVEPCEEDDLDEQKKGELMLRFLPEFYYYTNSISKLVDEYNIEQKQLSNLIVFSQLLDCPILNKTDINLIVRYNVPVVNGDTSLPSPSLLSSGKRLQETVKISLKASIETLVYEMLCRFSIDELNTSKYLLKIHGLEEYLPIDATLGELKYIHECITEDKDPILVLTEIGNVNIELTAKQDNQSQQLSYNQHEQLNHHRHHHHHHQRHHHHHDKQQQTDQSRVDSEHQQSANLAIVRSMMNHLEQANAHKISKTKLEHIIRNAIQNRNLIEECVESYQQATSVRSTNIQLDSVLNWCINLKEKLKYLSKFVHNVHYALIDMTIERLEYVEKSLVNINNAQHMREKQPLIMANDSSASLSLSLSSISSSSENNLNILYNSLVDASNTGIHAILEFVNSAALSFNWPFRLSPVFKARENDEYKKEKNYSYDELVAFADEEAIEIGECNDKLLIYFSGLSRLYGCLSNLSASAVR
jgi:hypothetical protein